MSANSTFHGISLWLTPSRLPSVPLGTVPHATSRDEEYMGYKIPAGRPNHQFDYVPLYNS